MKRIELVRIKKPSFNVPIKISDIQDIEFYSLTPVHNYLEQWQEEGQNSQTSLNYFGEK